MPLIDDTVYPNIGDRMTAAGISWNWYSGGWDDAAAGHPGRFQYHHQPFNYFAELRAGRPGRSHLQDETKFIAAAKNGTLPRSLRQALRRRERAPRLRQRTRRQRPPRRPAQDDHDGPAGQGHPRRRHVRRVRRPVGPRRTAGRRQVGPGHPHPALVLSAGMVKSGVDHTQYDTTSIMATIEHAYGLAPVATRDAIVNDLTAGDPHRRSPPPRPGRRVGREPPASRSLGSMTPVVLVIQHQELCPPAGSASGSPRRACGSTSAPVCG